MLSEAQKEEIIAQADGQLKSAKGRGYWRQITREEVIELLSHLPRDADGLVNFHDAQKLITGYRGEQIARFRVIFPDLVGRIAANHRTRDGQSSRLDEENSRNQMVRSSSGDGAQPDERLEAVQDTRSRDGHPAGNSRLRRGNQARACRAPRLSEGVAPPEMFLKDVGLTPAGLSKQVIQALLSPRCHCLRSNLQR